MVAFALQRVKYFVDLVHDFETSRLRDYGTFDRLRDLSRSPIVSRQLIEILWCIVLDVRGLVVARLPHIGAVAVRDCVDNPFGQIFGRRIEVQHLVKVRMVYPSVNQSFDFGEVAHHTVVVQFLGAAIHVNLPVVAMQVLTFALVVEIKLMAGRYF